MAPAVGSSGEAIVAQRRMQLAGASGVKGLVANGKTLSIACFASMGGLVYGYNQGMFGQVLSMYSFKQASGVFGISNPTLAGLLTSILELGAWVGVLANGYLADALGRRKSVIVACFFFCVGVIVQALTRDQSYDYILAGRFITGIGVGSLSMIVPLYNAELSPPEIRGSLVALQQLAITFGIMISYWITYGTNYIGGIAEGQSKAAWLVPITIQLVPALILAAGILFMPESPRHLINVGRDEEARTILANLRRLQESDQLIELEFLEIKAQKLFEDRLSVHDHPQYQSGSRKDNFMLGVQGYKSLFTTRSNLRRTMVAVLIMTFQQWTGVNFILYYAPFIFDSLNLTGNTTSLLASGVVGIVMFLATIPAVLYIDQWGRKPTLIAGSVVMGMAHFIVAGIIGQYQDIWNGTVQTAASSAAGWAAVFFIWVFAAGFGFSWGPVAWVIVAEVFPLGLRAKGVSIGASANWLNNFAVAMSTPDFVAVANYGAYIFLGMMCVLGAAYVYFIVPETKGRTLDELDEVFGDTSGRSRMETEMLQAAYKDVGLFAAAGGIPTGEKHGEFREKDEFTEKATA